MVQYHEAAEEELPTEIGYLELRARGLGQQGPLILAVAHHSRRPGYWAGRAGSEGADVGRG